MAARNLVKMQPKFWLSKPEVRGSGRAWLVVNDHSHGVTPQTRRTGKRGLSPIRHTYHVFAVC